MHDVQDIWAPKGQPVDLSTLEIVRCTVPFLFSVHISPAINIIFNGRHEAGKWYVKVSMLRQPSQHTTTTRMTLTELTIKYKFYGFS